jgi:hypothetical protein
VPVVREAFPLRHGVVVLLRARHRGHDGCTILESIPISQEQHLGEGPLGWLRWPLTACAKMPSCSVPDGPTSQSTSTPSTPAALAEGNMPAAAVNNKTTVFLQQGSARDWD